MMGGMAEPTFPATNTARAKHLSDAHPEIVQIPPGDYDLMLPLLHNIAHAAYERGRRERTELVPMDPAEFREWENRELPG